MRGYVFYIDEQFVSIFKKTDNIRDQKVITLFNFIFGF